jgi:hypothetical protein
MGRGALHRSTSSDAQVYLIRFVTNLWQSTAAVPPTGGQLVTSELGVRGGPLAFHYANLMSHPAFRQSLACVRIL